MGFLCPVGPLLLIRSGGEQCYNWHSTRTLDSRDLLVSIADMTAMALRHSYILLLCFSLLGCSQEPGEPSQTDKVIEKLRSLYAKALEQAPEPWHRDFVTSR